MTKWLKQLYTIARNNGVEDIEDYEWPLIVAAQRQGLAPRECARRLGWLQGCV